MYSNRSYDRCLRTAFKLAAAQGRHPSAPLTVRPSTFSQCYSTSERMIAPMMGLPGLMFLQCSAFANSSTAAIAQRPLSRIGGRKLIGIKCRHYWKSPGMLARNRDDSNSSDEMSRQVDYDETGRNGEKEEANPEFFVPSEEEKLVQSRYQTYAEEFLGSPWEQGIRVQLLDEKGNSLGKVSKAEARRKAFDRELTLVHLKGIDVEDEGADEAGDISRQLPVYQLMMRKEARKLAAQSKPQPTTRKEHKIRIFAKIRTNELNRKVYQIIGWLKNGRDVRVTILRENTSPESRNKALEVSKGVQEAVTGDVGRLASGGDAESREDPSVIKLLFLAAAKTQKKKISDDNAKDK